MPDLNQADLAQLLRDNLARSEEILATVRNINKHMRWQRIWAGFRFSLIVVPIILGFIYLPPLIKDAIGYYKSLLP